MGTTQGLPEGGMSRPWLEGSAYCGLRTPGLQSKVEDAKLLPIYDNLCNLKEPCQGCCWQRMELVTYGPGHRSRRGDSRKRPSIKTNYC
eukprot:1139526-Pelagomonas_calceolata.AAC.2